MKSDISFESHKIQADIIRIAGGFPDRAVPTADLEKSLGIGPELLLPNITDLVESGVGFFDGRRFALGELPDSILPPLILAGLRSRHMGRRIFAYKSIGSTNNTARRLAESDSPEGTLVIAEKQTGGRGRLGRSWHSPTGTGLYFSLILRPRILVEKLPALSLVAALSVCETIERLTDLQPHIKWPNDCLINGKKIAGILVDISAEIGRVSHAVLGIGLNVNTTASDFPPALRKIATSIAIESGGKFGRIGLLRSFLYEFEKSYRNFCRYGFEFVAPELIKKSVVIGQKISYAYGGNNNTGVALGYDENGGLRVKSKKGLIVLTAGEITIRRR